MLYTLKNLGETKKVVFYIYIPWGDHPKFVHYWDTIPPFSAIFIPCYGETNIVILRVCGSWFSIKASPGDLYGDGVCLE